MDNYHNLNTRIRAAAERHGRDPATVKLLAVSKRQSESAVRRVAACGQHRFAENYLQEAEVKIAALAPLGLEWHFIGELQSNKTRLVASLFDWVHSLDRIKIAERLDNQRPENAPALNVCIEVNISDERTKGGIVPTEVPGFVDELRRFSRLRLRGLMALPAPSDDTQRQRNAFRRLQEMMRELDEPNLDTLSMGTSNDFEAAIAEGATLIRIGTALFGPRG